MNETSRIVMIFNFNNPQILQFPEYVSGAGGQKFNVSLLKQGGMGGELWGGL